MANKIQKIWWHLKFRTRDITQKNAYNETEFLVSLPSCCEMYQALYMIWLHLDKVCEMYV